MGGVIWIGGGEHVQPGKHVEWGGLGFAGTRPRWTRSGVVMDVAPGRKAADAGV